jgi:methenyltetrahydrofolate cyclohydrolase
MMTEIKTQPIQTFLDALASKSATPGGGSAAALMGAQGAALVSMVCNLTIGKPKFAEIEVELQAVLVQAEALRSQLTELIQADIDVFNRLMSKYALPKETDDEKAIRGAAIQDVLKEATEVPLQCAHACAEVVRLSKVAADLGNSNVVSDAGAALMAAYAGLKISALNVIINANSLKDREFAETKLAELKQATVGIDHMVETLYQTVQAKL